MVRAADRGVSDDMHDEEPDAELVDEREEHEGIPANDASAAPRPRARRAPSLSAVSEGVEIGRFGAVPVDVTHWLVRRKDLTGEWKVCGFARPGALVEDHQFPLAELAEETIAERWGPGLYQVAWVRPRANGGRNVLRGTTEVRIVAPAPVVAAPAAAVSPMGEQFDFAMRIMGLIEKQSDAKINGMASMMQMMGNRGGLGAAELQLILQNQGQMMTQAITAAVAPLAARLDALAEDDEDDDDDDDEPTAVATVAKTAGSKLFKGSAWWQQVGAYLTENPQIVREVAPVVIAAVQNVTGAVAGAVAAQPQRARAVHVSAAPTPPPPPTMNPQPLNPAPIAAVVEPPSPVVELVPPPPELESLATVTETAADATKSAAE